MHTEVLYKKRSFFQTLLAVAVLVLFAGMATLARMSQRIALSLKLRSLQRGAVIAVAAILLLTGLALAGSSTTLLGYQIDYLSFTDNGNDTSTWTYAVTAGGDEQFDLSHWTLGIEACYDILTPANDAEYTTLTTGFGCGTTYTCEASTCTVKHGLDDTTGVTGIKFEDCEPQLGPEAPLPRTHIFQFTVAGVPIQGGDVDVAVKAGAPTGVGSITGPACSPTAVALNDFRAETNSFPGLALVAVGIALGLTGIGTAYRRARLKCGGEK